MKKAFLSFALSLFAVSGFSQAMTPVKIDSLVTVSMPSGYQEKDTTGRQVYAVNGSFGYIIVIREPNAKNNTPLKKEKDLNKVLKDYIKGIEGQVANGSAQNVRDTTVGALKAKTFTLKSDNSGDIEYRKFVLLHTQEVTYTFEYVYPDNRKDLVKDELKAFVSSIKLSPELQRNDQYLSNAKGLSSAQMAIIGGGGVLVFIVIIVLVRRKRVKS